jgi:hypothetical protein
VNGIERRMRNLINPYSTAFARWWCHAGRFMIPGNRTAVRSRRLGSAMPGPGRGVSDASVGRSAAGFWLAAQAARRAAVDELFASMDKGDGKGA